VKRLTGWSPKPVQRPSHPIKSSRLGVMPSVIDLSGQRFGRLTVTGRAMNRKGAAMWLCMCDCGNDTVVLGSYLRRGITRSCGCLSKQMAWSTDPVDLVGQRFGKLTVIARNHTKPGTRWDCVCDCGNTTTVTRGNLTRRGIKSCGCGQHPKLDFVGQRFGHYTVIERHEFSHDLKWVCRCDCGAVVEKNTWQLRNRPDDGHQDCLLGPETYESGQSHRPVNDLSGLTFGLLHVLRFDKDATDRHAKHRMMWLCRCECGTERTVRGSSLTCRKTRTCGSPACQKMLREQTAALWS